MKQTEARPALPIFIQPNSTIQLSGLRVVLDERGWPRAAIAEGSIPEDNHRLALYAATEFEEPVMLPSTKSGREWLHLAKIRDDLERCHKRDLSGVPRFGDNPPDFVLTDQSTNRVELAQLTSPRRREALSLLHAVKRALIRSNGNGFHHLRDRLVIIGFEDQRGLPPRANDVAAIENVLDVLRHTDPGPNPPPIQALVQPHGFAVSLKNSKLGQGEIACFPLPVQPNSKLATSCRFDIAASLTVVHRASDTETELDRLTREHDVRGNDILVISAGAPAGFDGFALISEEISVEPVILQTLKMPQPKYLKRVLLHRWSFGDVFELFPEFTTIVESKIDCTGPCVVPLGIAPEWAWQAECPCGQGIIFRKCHGT